MTVLTLSYLRNGSAWLLEFFTIPLSEVDVCSRGSFWSRNTILVYLNLLLFSFARDLDSIASIRTTTSMSLVLMHLLLVMTMVVVVLLLLGLLLMMLLNVSCILSCRLNILIHDLVMSLNVAQLMLLSKLAARHDLSMWGKQHELHVRPIHGLVKIGITNGAVDLTEIFSKGYFSFNSSRKASSSLNFRHGCRQRCLLFYDKENDGSLTILTKAALPKQEETQEKGKERRGKKYTAKAKQQKQDEEKTVSPATLLLDSSNTKSFLSQSLLCTSDGHKLCHIHPDNDDSKMTYG